MVGGSGWMAEWLGALASSGWGTARNACYSQNCTDGFGKKWPAMNKGVSNEDWIWYVAEKNARGKK